MIWAHLMWWLVNRRIFYAYLGFGIPINIEINYSGVPLFLHLLANYYPVPVFFILVGISLILSIENKKKNEIDDLKIEKYIFVRAIVIILISYLIFNLIIEGPITAFVYSWSMLHLIGLGTLITYYLLKFSKKIRILISVIIIVLSPIIQIIFNYQEIHYLYPIQGGIFSNMVYSGEFPLFPWLSFVILGSVIGELLIEASKKDKIVDFLKQISIYGIILIIFGSIIPIFNIPPYTAIEKYPCTTAYILFFTGAVLISLSISYYFLDYLKREIKEMGPFIRYGRFSLTVFLIHYFLGSRVAKLIGIYESLSYQSAAVITIAFYFACWVVLIIWSNYYDNKLSFEWLLRKISYVHFNKRELLTED